MRPLENDNKQNSWASKRQAPLPLVLKEIPSWGASGVQVQ